MTRAARRVHTRDEGSPNIYSSAASSRSSEALPSLAGSRATMEDGVLALILLAAFVALGRFAAEVYAQGPVQRVSIVAMVGAAPFWLWASPTPCSTLDLGVFSGAGGPGRRLRLRTHSGGVPAGAQWWSRAWRGTPFTFEPRVRWASARSVRTTLGLTAVWSDDAGPRHGHGSRGLFWLVLLLLGLRRHEGRGFGRPLDSQAHLGRFLLVMTLIPAPCRLDDLARRQLLQNPSVSFH